MISGYLSNSKKPIKKFVLGKIKSLYIPYVVFTLLFVLFEGALFKIGVKNYIKIFAMMYLPNLMGAAWFIATLFYSEIIFFVVYRLISYISERKLYLLILIFSIIMFIVGNVSLFPLFINRILIAISFLGIGDELKKIDFDTIDFKKQLIIVIMSIFTLVIFGIRFYSSYSSNTFPNALISGITALTGSVGIFMLSRIICNNNNIKSILQYIGSKTMGVVLLQFVGFRIVNYIIFRFYDLDNHAILAFPVNYEFNYWYWCIFYVIFGLFISIYIYMVYEKILCIIADCTIRLKTYRRI